MAAWTGEEHHEQERRSCRCRWRGSCAGSDRCDDETHRKHRRGTQQERRARSRAGVAAAGTSKTSTATATISSSADAPRAEVDERAAPRAARAGWAGVVASRRSTPRLPVGRPAPWAGCSPPTWASVDHQQRGAKYWMKDRSPNNCASGSRPAGISPEHQQQCERGKRDGRSAGEPRSRRKSVSRCAVAPPVRRHGVAPRSMGRRSARRTRRRGWPARPAGRGRRSGGGPAPR